MHLWRRTGTQEKDHSHDEDGGHSEGSDCKPSSPRPGRERGDHDAVSDQIEKAVVNGVRRIGAATTGRPSGYMPPDVVRDFSAVDLPDGLISDGEASLERFPPPPLDAHSVRGLTVKSRVQYRRRVV